MTHAPDDDPDEDLDDEAALRWAGDDARGQEAPRLGSPTDAESVAGSAEGAGHPARSSAAALVTAVFAVLYLALTVGWILAVQHTSSGTAELGTEILWQFGEFLAIAAAPLWFGSVAILGGDSRLAVRIGWLALGVGVLVPWPLVLGVVAVLVA